MNTTITTNRFVLLSKKGMKELRKTIAQLTHERESIIRGLREIDKSSSRDNRLDRIERLERLEATETELAEKKSILERARLMPTHSERLKVAIGSVVDLIDQHGRLVRYTLVDSLEANPSDGRISIASPLGKNLLGKTVHDIVEWGNGLKQSQFRLVKIG